MGCIFNFLNVLLLGIYVLQSSNFDVKDILWNEQLWINSRWRIQDGGYFPVKNVIVTSLFLLMATNLLSGTKILSDMSLPKLCGCKSDSEEILIK